MTSPCLNGRCESPVACGGFGYCRELNFAPAREADAVERLLTSLSKLVAHINRITFRDSVGLRLSAETDPIMEQAERTLAAFAGDD